MRFAAPLTEGRLVRRYKRFLADVELADGRIITAHCANPGSMLGLADPGIRVWLSAADDPRRKLAWSLELVEVDAGAGPAIVGINTGHPNRLVADAVGSGLVPELAGYDELRREVKYGRNSRIDLLLTRRAHPDCYVEVKNVHLMRTAGLAEFPDSVTARGAKHLDELADMVGGGARAVMFFLVQRGDAERLAIARDIDPGYAAALTRARSAGVEVIAYRCRVSPEAIALDAPVICED
jgi:sugar fermentation stimulation protein A